MMQKCSLLILFALLIMAFPTYCQPGWTWQQLEDMPEPVSNNAVTSGYFGDTLCVYSFSGIDETLSPSGIHLKSFRYNTETDLWYQLQDVPDTMGFIAAGATYLIGKIYLIGGYHVNENFSEVSSNQVHVYDTQNDLWLSDAENIPVAIDDHVQVLWQDSLIYVVTGWSNNGNVPNVQIFNPELNEWIEGTNVPNSGSWKAFGASGEIVGNRIYYHGGVNGTFAFNANSRLRAGQIDPENPGIIDWELLEDSPEADGYRSGAAVLNDRLFWIGGAGTAYNFDAMAYDGSGVVNPENRILTYYSAFDQWENGVESPFQVMDLRGVAKVSENAWIICGGIKEDGIVSSRTLRLEYDSSVDVGEFDSTFNLVVKDEGIMIQSNYNDQIQIEIFNTTGQAVIEKLTVNPSEMIKLEKLSPGVYVCRYYQGSFSKVERFYYGN
jgi:hypothetical protein